MLMLSQNWYCKLRAGRIGFIPFVCFHETGFAEPSHGVYVTDAERIAQLEASNRELRGALIFAGRRIRKLTQ